MARFNTRLPAVQRTPDTITAQGGEGFSRGIKDELFILGMANFVGIDTFYERGVDRDKRFAELVRMNAAADPAWTAQYIAWLRDEGNMRSAPIMATAEFVASKAPGARQLVASVLRRPDEPAELIGYWHANYGRSIPSSIKRGISDALPRLYTERNVLRYDGNSKAIRFGDVVELTHPKPTNRHQSLLYRHLIDRRHGRGVAGEDLPVLAQDAELNAVPKDERRANLHRAVEAGWSWERIAGWVPGGMDAAAWEAAIPNMGVMALIRNLRNFDALSPGLSSTAVAMVNRRLCDPEEIRKSRAFPLRFLTAWKASQSMRWGSALETAINLSLDNVPSLPGRTLVLVDVSPSMQDYATSNRGRQGWWAESLSTPRRWEVAGTFAAAIAARAESADVVLFDWDVLHQTTVSPSESVLRFAEKCGQWANKSCGTDILRALATSYAGHDRVVILTDEQQGYMPRRTPWGNWSRSRNAPTERFGWNDVKDINVPVFTMNLSGDAVGVTPNEGNWHTFGGLTDACFKAIPAIENSKYKHVWPWEVASAD